MKSYQSAFGPFHLHQTGVLQPPILTFRSCELLPHSFQPCTRLATSQRYSFCATFHGIAPHQLVTLLAILLDGARTFLPFDYSKQCHLNYLRHNYYIKLSEFVNKKGGERLVHSTPGCGSRCSCGNVIEAVFAGKPMRRSPPDRCPLCVSTITHFIVIVKSFDLLYAKVIYKVCLTLGRTCRKCRDEANGLITPGATQGKVSVFHRHCDNEASGKPRKALKHPRFL